MTIDQLTVPLDDLTQTMREAEREYHKKSYDHNVNCQPNRKGWDEAAWKRDFPFPSPGAMVDYVASAVLAKYTVHAVAEQPNDDRTEPVPRVAG